MIASIVTTLYLAEYDGAAPALRTTPEAARAHIDEYLHAEARGRCWNWIPCDPTSDDIALSVWTHPDNDAPTGETGGVVTPLTVALPQLAELAAENTRLRAQVAQLESELRIGDPWTCPACGKTNRRDTCAVCESDRSWADEMEADAAALLSSRCDACRHTLNWHRNDVGCTVVLCACGRFQPPAA